MRTIDGPTALALVDHIDVHFHLGLGTDEHDLFSVPPETEFEAWLAKAELAAPALKGASRHVLLPPIYYQLAAGIEDVRRLNDLMAAAAQRSDLKAAAAFGVVEPHHGDAAAEEVERIAGMLAGVVFSPRAQGVYGNTPELTSLIRKAASRDMISMVHVSANSGNEQLWRIWDLAEQCDGVPMVALGALSWENLQAIMRNPGRAPNLLYDTSGLVHLNQLSKLADTLGAERLLFGSGAHSAGDAHYRSAAVEGIVDAGLDAAKLRAILFENAARLFKTPVLGSAK